MSKNFNSEYSKMFAIEGDGDIGKYLIVIQL